MTRALVLSPLLLLAALLSGCQSVPEPAGPPPAEAALTPTEQYPLRADRRAEQILLAPHASGLSQAQSRALAVVAARWQEAGQGAIVIREPRSGADRPALAATSLAARSELVSLGVPAGRIRLEGYDPEGEPRPAIVVAYAFAEAAPPRCGRDWENLTFNPENRPMDNFGCAVSANLAAQIADPGDIIGPRPGDPADATRRTTVLGKYQQGVATGATDNQSTITISGVASGGGN